MINISHSWNRSLKPLVWGLVLSAIMILATYWVYTVGDSTAVCITIIFMGMIQALIQLFTFMHLGLEGRPHQGLMLFLFMILIMILIVGGSVWIMKNLGYNVMPDMKMP